MLVLEHLAIQLSQQTLLTDSCLTLTTGQCVGILGANGAGKSTLLKTLGQHLPYQGKIYWQQQNLAQLNWQQRAKKLVFMPQHSQLNFAFKVKEIVEMGLMMYPSLETKHRLALINQVMQLFEINHLANSNYLRLSGGEKQRVQASRTWLQILASSEEKLVLLDEPTSALDLKHQHSFLQATQQLAKQHLVLIVLHDLNLAARYCDHLILMKTGQALSYGSTEQMLTTANIQDLYGYQAEIHRIHGQIWVR